MENFSRLSVSFGKNLEKKISGNKSENRDEYENCAHQYAEGQGPFEQQLIIFIMVNTNGLEQAPDPVA
jgi:hypothetical protein